MGEQSEDSTTRTDIDAEDKENRVIDQMLALGRSLLFTWTPFGDANVSGFQTMHEEGQTMPKGVPGRDCDYQTNVLNILAGNEHVVGGGDPRSRMLLEDSLAKNRTFEVVVIRPLTKDVYQTRKVMVQKKGWFRSHQEEAEERYKSGVTAKTMDEATGNGSTEPACEVVYYADARHATDIPVSDRYINIQGRPGNILNIKFIVPVNLGRVVAETTHANPAFMRKVADKFIKQRYPKRFVDEIWSRPNEGKPPYKAWDSYGSRMYMVDGLDSKGEIEPGFDPKNMLEFL